MPAFTPQEKAFFRKNGYVVKHGVVARDLCERAVDAVWEHIEADRNDPATWVNAGPTGNLPCSDHPAIVDTVARTSVFELAEEIVGKGRLTPPRGSGPLCKMIYPTGHEDWRPPGAHLDGYIHEGVADTFTIGVTLNIADIVPRGGGFTCYTGSHEKVAEHFRSHSLLTVWDINRAKVPSLAPPWEKFDRYEHAAPAGSCVFWHHYMLHNASMNCSRNIRMALVTRFNFTNLREIQFDLPHDLWAQWDGLKEAA
jgi:hypothetical protein